MKVEGEDYVISLKAAVYFMWTLFFNFVIENGDKATSGRYGISLSQQDTPSYASANTQKMERKDIIMDKKELFDYLGVAICGKMRDNVFGWYLVNDRDIRKIKTDNEI